MMLSSSTAAAEYHPQRPPAKPGKVCSNEDPVEPKIMKLKKNFVDSVTFTK